MRLLVVLCVLLVGVVVGSIIHPKLQTQLDSTTNEVSFFVLLDDLEKPASQPRELAQREEQGTQFILDLMEHAKITQAPLLRVLEEQGIEVERTFWISNFITVKGNRLVADFIAALPYVRALEPVEIGRRLPVTTPMNVTQNHLTRREILMDTWNQVMVQAPDVWALGFTGTGIVVGGADTGIEWQHPALINQYRGWDGQSATHDFNWWDAIHNAGTGNPCGSDSTQPCDDNGHGTHTIGTAVGDDGAGNKIGIAPTANWIGCRNMDEGFGSPATYIECLQFFAAPTDLLGNFPDPSRRPHVVVNSYSCPGFEGCTDVNVLKSAVENVVAAGIFMSVAAGNSGPSCSTILDPPAVYESSFTVGASAFDSLSLASFSSRGPVNIAGEPERISPNVFAPGSSIVSSVPPSGYSSFSGTSMAAPHVAGVVALLYEAVPNLSRDIPNTRTTLQDSVINVQSFSCFSSLGIPNNLFGYGMVQALDAINLATTPSPSPSSPSISPSSPSVSPSSPSVSPSSPSISPSSPSVSPSSPSISPSSPSISPSSPSISPSSPSISPSSPSISPPSSSTSPPSSSVSSPPTNSAGSTASAEPQSQSPLPSDSATSTPESTQAISLSNLPSVASSTPTATGNEDTDSFSPPLPSFGPDSPSDNSPNNISFDDDFFNSVINADDDDGNDDNDNDDDNVGARTSISMIILMITVALLM